MNSIIKDARKKASKRENINPRPTQEETERDLKKRFGKKDQEDQE